jgi:acyl carrier protein
MKTHEFITIFKEELEIEDVEVTPETKLATLEAWDSVGVMVVVGMVAEHFKVTLTSKDMIGLTTVKSLIEKIGGFVHAAGIENITLENA